MRARIEDRTVCSPFPTVQIPSCSVYDAAKEALLKDPEKPALADGTVLVTRRELFVLMQRYAAGFQKHGLEPGHRVCVHLDNSTENFAAMWACVFAGASVVLVNASLTEREVHYQLRDSECTHVLTDPACAEKVCKAVASQKMKGLFATGPAEGFVSVAAFRQLDEASFREVLIQDPHDCVLCIGYTSGTTGLPKGAVTTHYGFVASMVTARPCFARDKSDVVLVAAPMLHGSGFFFITVSVLLGATVVMASLGVTLQRVSDLVNKYKMLKTCNRLAGVRRIQVGGDALTETTRGLVQAAFSDLESVANEYAMTESVGILCSPTYCAATHGTDVGYPTPSSQIKVVDMLTREKLGPNKVGEICFRTPSIIKEYYKRPNETAQLFDEDSWCKSDNMALHKNLFGGVFFLDSLPKTQTGKMRRTELAQECKRRNAL